jgi:hypothetical protein
MNLRITLKQKAPLVKMKALYGGLLVISTRSWGSSYHIWIQQSTGDIEGVLGLWLPWLVEKQSQARVALEYCRFLSGRKRGKVYSKRDRARCERWERKLKALKHGK